MRVVPEERMRINPKPAIPVPRGKMDYGVVYHTQSFSF